MTDPASRIDSVLGYGGLALAVVAWVSLVGSPEIGGNADVLPTLVGIAMVAWIVVVTIRHVRVHPDGSGRAWMISSWVVLVVLVAWAMFQAIDTAAFDDGIVDGLLTLGASPPRLVLMTPLVLASIGILRDGHRPRAAHRRDLPAPG